MFKKIMQYLYRKLWLKKNDGPAIEIPQMIHRTTQETKHVYGPRRKRFPFIIKPTCVICGHKSIIGRQGVHYCAHCRTLRWRAA